MIEASVVLDSINPSGSRLVTMLTRYPKFVHAEHCRHRSFSFSVSSSRAIPTAKNFDEVWDDQLRASPVYWGAEQKGMAAGAELDEDQRHTAASIWRGAAYSAIDSAKALQALGVHKSIVNRVLEPFLHVNVLVTGTTDGWMNFFGLRLDKYAQPEIRALAEAQWKLWNESQPKLLQPGEWHLPFVDQGASGIAGENFENQDSETKRMLKVSTARCARLSYLSFETNKRSTIEEDLALYDRLITSRPIHASPAEHQATPDEIIHQWIQTIEEKESDAPSFNGMTITWEKPQLAGNLGPGWIQYRKTLPDERVATLPEGYR